MYFNQEVHRIKKALYANEHQLEVVIALKQYILKNYSEAIDLDAMAAQLFVSKYHLLRLFKRYYGMTPRQFLIETRIRQAKQLLLDGHSVKATCLEVGFQSVPTFIQLFKNITTLTPTQFATCRKG